MKQNAILLIVVVVVVIAAIVGLESIKTPVDRSSAAAISTSELAPDIQPSDEWINSDPLSLEDLRGKVVMVDFWTYSCINCVRTLPYMNAWYDKYHDDGLVIIGVHTPEFAFEHDLENVQDAVKKYDIKFPVVLDNDYATWRAYQNRYWPHKFLIDKDGRISYDHIGEGAYDETEKVIQELLAEIGSSVDDSVVDLTDNTPSTRNTHELYLGADFALPRGQDIGNDEGLQRGKIIDYSSPESRSRDVVYLSGEWRSDPDAVVAQGPGTVALRFSAKAAYFVADGNQEVVVSVDGVERSVIIDGPQLYTAFEGDYGTHELLITVDEGFSLNSFTFG